MVKNSSSLFRKFSLLLLMFIMRSVMASADAVSVTYPLTTGAAETGVSSADVFSVKNMTLNGPNGMAFDGTGTWDDVTYTLVKSVGATSATTDYLRFMVKPKLGVSFMPTSLSFKACRFGTDATRFKVVVNGTALVANGLQSADVMPGRNKADAVNDGYDFTYTIPSQECTNAEPCYIDIYITNGAGKSFGLKNIVVEGTYSGEPVDLSTNDFEAILNNQTGTLIASSEQVQNTPLNFGVAHDGTRVAADAASAVGIVNGAYHSDHGMANITVTAKVLGPVRITVGECAYSTNPIVVKNSSQEVVASKTPNAACWKNDHNNVAVLYYNGPADNITISGMGYLPYIKVEAVDVSEIPTTVNLSFGSGDAAGTAPSDKEAGIGSEFTLPINQTLYKDGYTLTGWNDGTDTYAPGATYVVGDVNVEFSPVFTQNTKTLADRAANVVLTYPFGIGNGGPAVSWQNLADQPLVAQATVAGETIDVPMYVNTESGKFASIGRTDSWAQVNNGTVFTIPSCKGATVRMEAYSALATTTINGSHDYESEKTITVTIPSVSSSATIVVSDGGGYLSYVRVTLPALLPEITSDLSPTYTVQNSVDRQLSVAANYATSYQWYTATASDKTGEAEIPGATSASYTFNRSVNGTYYIYCKVTNAAGTISSNVATVTVTDEVHTFDFTNWSAATVVGLKADAGWNTSRDATAIVDQAHWNTDVDKNGTNDRYIMGGAWTTNVPAGTLTANGSVISETYGLLFDGPMTDNASAIVYDQQVDYTLGGPLTYNYQGAQYLQLGAGSGFVIPNVRVGSVISFNIEAHDFANASGINLFLGSASGTKLTNATTDNGWLTTTRSNPSMEITSAVAGGADYVDIYVQPTSLIHIYTIDADMAFGLTTKEKALNPDETYTLTEGRDYFIGTGGGEITFASADTDIATVDGYGKITAVSPGTVNITVTRAASGVYPANSETLAFTVDAPATVTYSTGGAEGSLPASAATQTLNKGTRITLPAGPNHYLYKEGYTMTGWTDGTDTYDFGAQYVVSGDVTLSPVFTANTASIATREGAVTVLVDLQRMNGAPTLSLQNVTGIYVVQASVDGQTIDVKVGYDTNNGGKLANGNWDDWCQANGGTKFFLPSCAGAVVSLETYNVSTTTSINGVALTGNESKTPAATVTSVNDSVTVEIGNEASYMRWIQVVLPAKAKILTDLNGTFRVVQGRAKTLSIEVDQLVDYQWYSNTSDSNTGGTPIEGATSASYNFVTTSETVPGNYYFYCVASNALGSLTSGVATVIVESITKNHTFDFTNWSETSFDALASDATNWSDKEKANNKAGNDGVGYYNHVAIDKVLLKGNGHEVTETFPLRFTADAHGLGLINNLGSTDLGTYAGEQYLWLMGKDKSAIIVPNVKTGSSMKLGIESHKMTDARGVKVYYGSAANDEWVLIGDSVTKEFKEVVMDIPAGTTAGYTDVKIVCSVAGSHLYYIDCEYNDFALLNEELTLNLGDTYTLANGVDYMTTSNAAITYSVADNSVVTVNADGEISTVEGGSTNLTVTQAGHDGLPVLSHVMKVTVLLPSDLNALKSEINVSEGDTYAITRQVDYNTSSAVPVTFTSSDENVITVSEEGVISIISDGEATITLRQAAGSTYNAGVAYITVKASLATDFPVVLTNIGEEKTIFTYTSTKLQFATTGATSYQWYSCDGMSMTNPVAIEGANEDTYYVRHITPGEGYYYCIAQNSKGKVVSDVCHITSVRKVQWSFVSNSDVGSLAEPGYMSPSSKGRLICDMPLNDEEMKINSKLYTPVTEGIFITRNGNNVLIGDSTNASNNRLQIAKGSIRIPDCKEGEMIVVNAMWASKNKAYIIPDTIGTNIRCAEEGRTADSLTANAVDYKYIVTADGDVTLNIMESALFYISIMSAHPIIQQTYDVKAVASSDESIVLKTYVTEGKGWTDTSVKVPYSYWLKDSEGRLYTHGSSGQPLEETFALASDTTFLIKYSSTETENVIFLSEAEDIEGAVQCTNANSFIRSSMNKAAYSDEPNGLKVTTLPVGSYRIKAVIFDPAKTATSQHTFAIGKTTVTLTASKTNFTEVESEVIDVLRPTDLLWMPTEDQQSGIDILCIYDTQMPTAEMPEITVNDDDYTFTLSTTEETGKIYYTLDGSDPSRNNGTLYEEGHPVQLASNSTIKAVTIASEKLPSTINVRNTDFKTYKLSVVSLPSIYGIVNLSPKSNDGTYLPGAEVKMTARPKSGYAFVGWSTTADGEIISDDHIMNVNVQTTGNTYYAHFASGATGYVKFDVLNGRALDTDGDIFVEFADEADNLEELSEYVRSCTMFPTDFVESHAINIPSDYTLFMDFGQPEQYSFALQYWLDKDSLDAGKIDRYELGESRMFKTEGQHVTLIPVFKDMGNFNVLSNRKSGCQIMWDFRTGYGAQALTLPGGVNSCYYSTHAEILGRDPFGQTVIDVPMMFSTANAVVGNDGEAVSNEDIDTWMTMVEGTEIIIPSGMGAEFTLATYGPIRKDGGTTINGQAPDNIDDEYIPRTDEGGYIYKWTVNDADLRDTLRIGNDYSYYQYLTANLPNAEYQYLKVASNNTGMGTVSVSPEAPLTENGYTFTNGSTVTVTANRNRFYNLDYWQDEKGYKYYPDGHYEDENGTDKGMFAGRNINDIVYGEVTPSTIQVSLSTSMSLTAFFTKKASYYVDFSAGGQAEGLPPYQQHVEWDEKFVMPKHNQHLYLEGHTLQYYTDEDGNRYDFGQQYLITKNILLTPHFKSNSVSVSDLTNVATVKWPLAVAEGATEISFSKSAGLIVDQLRIGNDSIDMPCYIDGNKGMADNTILEDYCQVGSGCIMTLPVMHGCTIAVSVANGNLVNTSIAGTSSQNLGNTTGLYTIGSEVSVTYDGSNTSETVQFRESREALWLSVTYPVMTEKPTLSSVTVGGTPLTADQLATLSNDGSITVNAIPDYEENTISTVSATASGYGTVTVMQATPTQPAASLILKDANGTAVATYMVNFSFIGVSAPALNGVTVSGKNATADGSTTVDGVGVNGVIALNFTHAMNDVVLTSDKHGLAVTEDDGRITGTATVKGINGSNVYTLTFTYWGLTPGVHTMTIPANTLTDAFGTQYPTDITVKFRTSENSVSTKRIFDFVVTHKRTWDAKTQTAGELVQTVSDDVLANLNLLHVDYGTIEDAINAANSKTGSDRYYIFVPNGEYQTKGTDGDALTSNFSPTEKYYATKDGEGFTAYGCYNGRTFLTRDNVSIIGQSQDRTVIFNDPYLYGLSYCSTLEVRSKVKNAYFQDFTLENRYSNFQVERGDNNPNGQAVAAYDRGVHSIWKNITMKSYQDTYASASNTSGSATQPGTYHTYRYYEDCQVWGTVDFVCGSGDSWWERPTFVIRNRANADNIVAANTFHTSLSRNYEGDDYMFNEKWGFVFANGSVKAEDEATYASQNGKYTIARTWQRSPANTFINTHYEVTPLPGGYTTMNQNLLCRMHEYNSMNADGTPADLTKRTLRAATPAAGSDDCILTDEQASLYTLHNVLGGDDGYDPSIYTRQISMENSQLVNSSLDDGTSILTWSSLDDALCYFVFRIDEATGDTIFHTIVTNNTFAPSDKMAGQSFLVRAANERGGLGAPSNIEVYKPLDTYEVSVKEVGPVPGMGWSTVCLPQNTTFNDKDGVTVYAAVKAEKTSLLLKKVTGTNGLKAGRGYIIYAPAPAVYTFRGTYKNPTPILGDIHSVLDGNPEDHAVSVGTLNIYTLAFKSDINNQVGFYKFVGKLIPAYKAYLDNEFLEANNITLDNLAKGLNMIFFDDEDFEEDATDVQGVTEDDGKDDDTVFDLSGKRVPRSQMRKGMIYVIDGEKVVWDGE